MARVTFVRHYVLATYLIGSAHVQRLGRPSPGHARRPPCAARSALLPAVLTAVGRPPTNRALTLRREPPAQVRVESIGEPPPADGEVLVETLAIGICDTDRAVVAGASGAPPPGQDHLVLGHEVVGRVLDAPPRGPLTAGQLVTAAVRRPGPFACARCREGEWDMCEDGRFTEHGINGRHGFARERFRSEEAALFPVPQDMGTLGILIEPASVVAKAWAQLDLFLFRSPARPRRVLVSGAGPIGLLAALFAARRGLEVHVVERVDSVTRARLVAALGAQLHRTIPEGLGRAPDIIVEATGDTDVVRDVLTRAPSNSLTCLLGVTHGPRRPTGSLRAMNDGLVQHNKLVFGSVNANLSHYALALNALRSSEHTWLRDMITRRVTLDDGDQVLQTSSEDITTMLTFPALHRDPPAGDHLAGAHPGSLRGGVALPGR